MSMNMGSYDEIGRFTTTDQNRCGDDVKTTYPTTIMSFLLESISAVVDPEIILPRFDTTVCGFPVCGPEVSTKITSEGAKGAFSCIMRSNSKTRG